ncbi:zinc finger protein [Theobroma cacao]|uniref:DNA-directed RNA polymerase subunit n=3 Tax=Byttnerioideae TaxID=214909 RepID=A0AB32WSL7_THECC|nr:PREDICTED: DNA-directed RNA polymerase I subunit RPA12 [Theobroma cacao]XP_017981727.1 PREDICTED: DNA-directed RNA polymerase I subunit RPA12 [Theobroma cacao]XP_021283692.1 DNA-directed RNA polymerase I subunit RPA12-like [Herrania umbratica]EOY15075.1 TFIIB zinc-binding protein, putative [Theobroma cacao]WRX30596.1 zinc finger protein [Theobroma cacao]
MAYSQARDFMFCSFCGSMLSLVSPKYAECPLCKFKPSAKGILGREIGYTITAEDIRRDLGISHVSEGMKTKESAALIKQTCKKCGHPELEYTTRQMRSADEGQTVFLVCPNCKFKDTEN